MKRKGFYSMKNKWTRQVFSLALTVALVYGVVAAGMVTASAESYSASVHQSLTVNGGSVYIKVYTGTTQYPTQSYGYRLYSRSTGKTTTYSLGSGSGSREAGEWKSLSNGTYDVRGYVNNRAGQWWSQTAATFTVSDGYAGAVMLLNDADATTYGYNHGHNAIIVIYHNGDYAYYSFGPKGNVSRKQVYGKVSDLYNKLSSSNYSVNIGGIMYETWYMRKVDNTSAANIETYAYNNKDRQYVAVGYQCDNYASEAMGAGGVGYWVGGNPNASFNNVLKTWAYKGVGTYGTKTTFKNYLKNNCGIIV